MRSHISSIVAALIGSFTAHLGFVLAYVSTIAFTRGRQHRKFGQPILPEIGEKGGAWAEFGVGGSFRNRILRWLRLVPRSKKVECLVINIAVNG